MENNEADQNFLSFICSSSTLFNDENSFLLFTREIVMRSETGRIQVSRAKLRKNLKTLPCKMLFLFQSLPTVYVENVN